MGKIPA